MENYFDLSGQVAVVSCDITNTEAVENAVEKRWCSQSDKSVCR